jgi:preprotein translocase subunit SecA
MGVQKDEDLTHRWISKAIEKAQQRVEAYNFDIRKQLLRYDDVMNDQRKIVYDQRKSLMNTNETYDIINGMVEGFVESTVSVVAPAGTVPDQWDMPMLTSIYKKIFNIDVSSEEIIGDMSITQEILLGKLEEMVTSKYQVKSEKYGREIMNYIEKDVLLKTLDHSWRKHLMALEHLRRGINLRAYAQKNPLNEYKFEAFSLFQNMMESYKEEVLSIIFHFEINRDPIPEPSPIIKPKEPVVEKKQESRNRLCPCGSGKRYKHCCGRMETVVEFEENAEPNTEEKSGGS